MDYTDKYTITDEDFSDQFHRIIFGAIYKVHELGAETINLNLITDFLSQRPKSYEVFTRQKGEEWLLKASQAATSSAFDYYYNRLKKFSLLRAYDNIGFDVSFIYDPNNILDLKKKQQQEEFLDNSSLTVIAQKIQDKIVAEYVNGSFGQSTQAGEGIFELIESLKNSPEVGVPLYGDLINTVTRGARLKKFYLRSGATGTGKSRTMMADACNIGCNKIYNDTFGWINNGVSEPTLYITTELDLTEVQTAMIAFLSGVNEEHILNGKYIGDEEKRVMEAAQILKDSQVYIEELPDFSITDVEDSIRKNIRDHDVKYVFFDYLNTSMKIIEEVGRRSGGAKLREDTILYMLAIRLKDICNEYGIFILSATQLNANYVDSDEPDQNLLRGAKSIAD